MVLLQRKLSKHIPGGSPAFSGGGGGGVQMLISIEAHITCDFPAGGGGRRGPDPLSPLWIGTWNPSLSCHCFTKKRINRGGPRSS